MHTYQIDLLIFKVANIQLIIYCAISCSKNIYFLLNSVFQALLKTTTILNRCKLLLILNAFASNLENLHKKGYF
ncbi:hypothetical protein ASE21_03960 [Flavobacterium sp. Root901]|nr:hypothetical protein ASE21_03960 [Flavobacterium sp. Root901]